MKDRIDKDATVLFDMLYGNVSISKPIMIDCMKVILLVEDRLTI